jgi:hypothetical protein
VLASTSEFDDDESEVLELLSFIEELLSATEKLLSGTMVLELENSSSFTIEELESSTSDDDSGVFTEFVAEDPSSPHAAKRIDAASKIFIFMIVPLLYKFIFPDNYEI